jgi:hypothetical protein
MPSLYLYLIGGVALLGVGFGGGFALEQHLTMDKIAQLSGDLSTAKGNEATLGEAVTTCNASVASIATAGNALTAATQSLIDAAKAGAANNAANIKAMNAIKSSDEKCPVADAIIQQAFQ